MTSIDTVEGEEGGGVWLRLVSGSDKRVEGFREGSVSSYLSLSLQTCLYSETPVKSSTVLTSKSRRPFPANGLFVTALLTFSKPFFGESRDGVWCVSLCKVYLISKFINTYSICWSFVISGYKNFKTSPIPVLEISFPHYLNLCPVRF